MAYGNGRARQGRSAGGTKVSAKKGKLNIDMPQLPGYPGGDGSIESADGRTGYQMNVKKSPHPSGRKTTLGGGKGM